MIFSSLSFNFPSTQWEDWKIKDDYREKIVVSNGYRCNIVDRFIRKKTFKIKLYNITYFRNDEYERKFIYVPLLYTTSTQKTLNKYLK